MLALSFWEDNMVSWFEFWIEDVGLDWSCGIWTFFSDSDCDAIASDSELILLEEHTPLVKAG